MFISVGLVGKRRRTDGQMLNRYPAMDSVDHEVSSGKKKRVAVYFHRKPAIGWNDLGSRVSLWLDMAGARMHAHGNSPAGHRLTAAARHTGTIELSTSLPHTKNRGRAGVVRRPVRRRHPSACHIRRGSCRRRARNSGRRRVAPPSLDPGAPRGSYCTSKL
jgi:hypothetical protein